MNVLGKKIVAVACVTAIVAYLAPATALASEGSSRLEGILVGLDGRPAEGYRVLLLDGEGQVLASSGTGEEGIYRFRDLPAGSYGLGIESPEGLAAPVDAPPARVGDATLVRRDIKLMESPGGVQLAPAAAQGGVGSWWAGLSRSAKAWTVVALVVVVGITVYALTDESEPAASPIDPE